MTTLFDLVKKTYLALGQLEISTATGGSTSTIIDTKLGEKYGDDDIVGSSVLIIMDAGGDNVPPEQEVSTVTGYVASSNTIQLSPSFTVAVASGDKYGIAKNIIDLNTMIEIINDALQSLGTIQLADTSITTLDNTTEYSIPVGLKYKITGVQVQTEMGAGNEEYITLSNWYLLNSAAGSTGLLCFTESMPAGYKLKILYESEHPKMNAMSNKLSETIHSEFATKVIIDRALEYQIRRTNGTDPFLIQTQNKAMADVEMARNRFSQPKYKKPKYLTPRDKSHRYYKEDVE
jgi:hypothetical protein